MFAFRRLGKVAQSVALIAAAFALFSAPAISQAAEPGKDPPLVGRYDGSVMKTYQAPMHSKITLFKGPYVRKNENNYFLKMETLSNRSGLEAHRNYESGPKAEKLYPVAIRQLTCGAVGGFVGSNEQ